MFGPSGLRATLSRALALFAVVSFAACAHGGGSKKKKGGEDVEEDTSAGGAQIEDPDHPGQMTTKRGEVLPSVTYGEGVEEDWKLGEAAFEDEDYLAAQRYYTHIRTKYPFSQYAALSDLRIGDCQYARGRYIEAIDSYQNFIRLHPTHEKVPYALYRTGLSHYQQIPSDWFLMPPSEEKEQTAVHDAERSLKDYVERFPNDENIADGKKLLVDVRKRLVAHERYVANFYARLGKDRAYVGRLETIKKDFKDVALDDALLIEMATVYARLGDLDRVKALVAELEKLFPASPRLAEARALVATAAPTPKSEPSKGEPSKGEPSVAPSKTATTSAAKAG